MISRCFWYDEDGKSYKRREGGEGCVTARCRFIHPWEKEWSRASPSTRLPPRYLIPYEEEVRLYSPPRERRRERSWSRSRDRDRARMPDRRMRRTTRSRTRSRTRSWSRSRSRSRGADRSRGRLDSRVSRRSRSPRRRRSPSPTTTIRSSRSPPPPRQPISSDMPYDTPPDPSPLPSVEADRENTRLPPSEPRALRKHKPSVKEEPKHEPTREPSQSLPEDKTSKPCDSLPGPSADIAIPADPLASPTSTAPPQTITGTSTPPPQVLLPAAAASVTAPIIPVDTTSPTIEAPQPIRISPLPTSLLLTETPTRTSSIAGLDDILAHLRVQNSVSDMDMSTPATPVPVPTPPTEPPPPVPASPPPPGPPTVLAGTSANAAPPAEAQASPTTPSGLSSNPNEQRKVWQERIELLTDVLQKRESLMSLEESRALYSRLAGTVNSPDDLAERGRYKAESINYSMKRMAKEKEYNDAIGKLTNSEAWRLLRLESGADMKANRAPKKGKVDADATKMLADIKGAIASVMDAVKELHGLVQEVGGKHNVTIPTPPGVPITTPAPAPNPDVEMKPASPKAQSDTALSQSSEQSTPSSLSIFHDTLKAIEDRLTDIEGNLNQRQEEIGEEIQSALETQFHDLKLSLEEPNPILSEVQKLSQSNSERLTTIGVEIGRTGGEIDELAREVVEAIKVNNEVAQGSESLAQENAWLRNENARLQKALDEMERRQNEELAVMRAETDEAKALLQEYLSRPPPPQMPPLDALTVALVPLVRNALRPLLEELHAAINELLTTKVSILNESVRQRMQVLWDMVTTFQLWADQVRDGVDPGYLLRRVHPDIHGAQASHQ